MSPQVEKIDSQALLKNALLEMRKMRSELKALEQAKTEPIAIIGIGCRLPKGANDPEAFWQLLQNGVDAVTEIPADRWNVNDYYDPDPEALGKMYTRHGSFLDRIDEFDPKFFGISPREAERMDPQQRLLLETSWEALEDAGQTPDQLHGSQTGVFIGIFRDDYAQLGATSSDLNRIDAYSSLGAARSIAVGRVSYFFGFQGPTIQLDTACSSSLLATHLACQSLRARECNLALAGGVTIMVTPSTTIGNCKLKALAKDGRCKTFDATADGYGRGEGCGIVVLKRLSDAIANKDNILAVIRGSAVNHDGRSNGLTAPNGAAQEALLRQALDNAKVQPQQIQYVEVHGTGTSLGDPIEVLSLGAVLGKGRTADNPLQIGSVKTNIGHLEAAAGVAALIKVVLALKREAIPPHLHFKQPNPYIPWEKLPVKVPTELTPWTAEKERFAGISAFSMSGTNVHVILEAAPTVEPAQETSPERSLHLLTISAKSEAALRDLASRYVTYLKLRPQTNLGDFCFTANTGRSHFDHRLAVWARATAQMLEQMEAVAHSQPQTGWVQGQAQHRKRPQIAFLFTGQGSQYVDMGRELYETQPTFRQTLQQCDRILHSYLTTPLLEVLYSPEKTALLDQTAYTQPALFALEYALVQLWKSWGVEPTVVMGHSVGEYVAACIAGVFSLEDGLKLIAQRGRLIQALPPDGQMVAVFADLDKVKAAILEDAQQVAIAAYNAPESIVISGQNTAVGKVVAKLQLQGIQTQTLKVSHAFHSPLMEPMLGEFERVASSISYYAPQLDLVSNLTGELAQAEIATPEYWCRHLREPVRFTTGMMSLYQQKYELFVEIGPKPTLLGLGRYCLPADAGTWLPSLRPRQSDWQTLLQCLGELYVRGVAVNWSGFDCDYSRRRLQLPTYPFQHQRYWMENADIQPSSNGHSTPNYINGDSTNEHSADPSYVNGDSADGRSSQIASKQESEILQRLKQTPAIEHLPLLISFLQNETATVLGLGAADLPDPHLGFFDMGMDSLLAVELKTRLERSLGLSLSSTLAFNYPNIASLAAYLGKEVLCLNTSDATSSESASRFVSSKRLLQIAAQIEPLSDEEVEALLHEKLSLVISY